MPLWDCLIAVKPFWAEGPFVFPMLFINLKAEISKEFQKLLLMVVDLKRAAYSVALRNR
jgi:hypothetical protein